jgi:hypothetical protein
MELEIKGEMYRTEKLDTFVAFHIGRRLMPAYFALGAGAVKALANGAELDALPLEAMAPIVDVMATMKNEDSQYIMDQCLAVVHRQSGQGWQRVTAANGKLQFEDIRLPIMLQLVATVIRENLNDFFPAAPTDK